MLRRHLLVLGVVAGLGAIAMTAEATSPPSTDLTILNGSYSTIGYIRTDGSVLDSSYSTIGHLREDGSVLNGSYSTIGYVRPDGSILNSSYSTVGYLRDDGTLLDSSYSTIGYIRSDGTILNSSYSTVGHVRPGGGDADAIAAFLFFFQPQMLAANCQPAQMAVIGDLLVTTPTLVVQPESWGPIWLRI